MLSAFEEEAGEETEKGRSKLDFEYQLPVLVSKEKEAAGGADADDGENWSEVTAGARGSQSVKHDFYYGMGLGCDGPDERLPGSVGHTMSEHPQRGFYKNWRKLMEAGS